MLKLWQHGSAQPTQKSLGKDPLFAQHTVGFFFSTTVIWPSNNKVWSNLIFIEFVSIITNPPRLGKEIQSKSSALLINTTFILSGFIPHPLDCSIKAQSQNRDWISGSLFKEKRTQVPDDLIQRSKIKVFSTVIYPFLPPSLTHSITYWPAMHLVFHSSLLDHTCLLSDTLLILFSFPWSTSQPLVPPAVPHWLSFPLSSLVLLPTYHILLLNIILGSSRSHPFFSPMISAHVEILLFLSSHLSMDLWASLSPGWSHYINFLISMIGSSMGITICLFISVKFVNMMDICL